LSSDLPDEEQRINGLSLDKIVQENLHELNPAQVWDVYLKAQKEKRVDLLPELFSSDWFTDYYKDHREEFLSDIRNGTYAVEEYRVSPVYLSQGNQAVVFIESQLIKQDGKVMDTGQVNVRAVNEHGHWLVPPFAAQ